IYNLTGTCIGESLKIFKQQYPLGLTGLLASRIGTIHIFGIPDEELVITIKNRVNGSECPTAFGNEFTFEIGIPAGAKHHAFGVITTDKSAVCCIIVGGISIGFSQIGIRNLYIFKSYQGIQIISRKRRESSHNRH